MRTHKYLRQGKYTRGLPKKFYLPFEKSFLHRPRNSETVREVIAMVRKYFSYEEYVTITHNVEKSRFVTLKNVIAMRLRTCGALASVTAAVLRRLGYPTKLIDGRLQLGKESVRHAWLEVTLEGQRKPFSIDPSRSPGIVTKHYKRRAAYLDWSELEEEMRGT